MVSVELEHLTGLILAGGRAERMAGRDKGLLSLAGEPLVAHVLRRLQPQVADVLISANRHLESYRRFGCRVVADAEPERFAGPLAGLLAAMRVACTPYLLTVPCDSPLLPLNYARRMQETLAAANADVAVARFEGSWQPVFALVPVGLQNDLVGYLASARGGVGQWLQRYRPVAVEFFQDSFGFAFANVNTPADLAQLEAVWRDRGAAVAAEEVAP